MLHFLSMGVCLCVCVTSTLMMQVKMMIALDQRDVQNEKASLSLALCNEYIHEYIQKFLNVFFPFSFS